LEFPPQFLTEPKIYVIAQTKPNRLSMDDAIAEILGEHTSDAWTAATIGEDDASVLTAFAAKTCYQSYGSGRNMQEHIEQLLSSYHGSTLAHFSMTFLITQVSRSLTHELVRHGIGTAYSQLSQRYVNESNVRFVIPPLYLAHLQAAEMSGSVKAMKDAQQFMQGWMNMCFREQAYYQATVEEIMQWPEIQSLSARSDRLKAAREAARNSLPNAAETAIVVTANNRSLRHMIEMRASRYADAEICRLFDLIFQKAREIAPRIYEDFNTIEVPGKPYLVEHESKWRKV
jgi:thymidylate synthase (FAD)